MKDQIYHLRPYDLTLLEEAVTCLVNYRPERLPAALDLALRLELNDLEKRLQLAVNYYRDRQGVLMPQNGVGEGEGRQP
ncbi:MAG: hypothetical protein ACRD2K_05380 [Terriglobales bacterium]